MYVFDVCVYIYIERDIERERYVSKACRLPVGTPIELVDGDVAVAAPYMYTYIYIYVYRGRERDR